MLDAPIQPGADLFITIFILAVSVVAGVALLDVIRSVREEKPGKENEKGVMPSSTKKV